MDSAPCSTESDTVMHKSEYTSSNSCKIKEKNYFGDEIYFTKVDRIYLTTLELALLEETT